MFYNDHKIIMVFLNILQSFSCNTYPAIFFMNHIASTIKHGDHWQEHTAEDTAICTLAKHASIEHMGMVSETGQHI